MAERDWKAYANDWATKARPFAAKAWSEIRQTAAATWAQGARLYGYGIDWWRHRDAGQKALHARQVLGEGMFRVGQGDAKLRQAIADLDDRLRSIEAAKGSTAQLQVERRGLAIRLAEGPLAGGSAPQGVEAEFQAAVAAGGALEAQQAALAARRATLWPADPATRNRTIAGAVTLVLLLFVCTWWLTRSDQPAPQPTPTPTPAPSPEPSPTPTPQPASPPTGGETPPPPPSPENPVTEFRAADLFAQPPRTEEGKQVLDGLGIGDLEGARAALERMRNVGETDEKYAIFQAALPLLENEIIDPFTLITYTFNFDENSAAFIPNGQADPVDQMIANLRAIGNNSPSLRPFIADTVRCTLAGAVNIYVNGGGNVGLSDDILFSMRPHSETGGKGTSTLSHAHLISNPAAAERFHGQRMWFVEREVPNAKTGFHLAGIWQKAAAFADELDPASRERWQAIYFGLASRFAADGRFQSAVLVLVRGTNYNHFAFLTDAAKQLDRSDHRKVTNLVIAFGYIMEAWAISGEPFLTKEQMKGSVLLDLGQLLIEIGDPQEVKVAFACAGLDRALFAR